MVLIMCCFYLFFNIHLSCFNVFVRKYEQLQQEMNKMAQVRLAELTQKRAQKTLATNRQVQLYLREW